MFISEGDRQKCLLPTDQNQQSCTMSTKSDVKRIKQKEDQEITISIDNVNYSLRDGDKEK